MISLLPLAIVGGAGPLVTAHLQCELLHAYQRIHGAQLDHEFPAIVSFNRALAGVDQKGVRDKVSTASDLSRLAQQATGCQARLAIVPCASLSPLLPEDTSELRWVRWVDHAAHRLSLMGARRMGVIGSRSARRDGVFRRPLERWGMEAIELPPALQDDADALIWQGMTGHIPEAFRSHLDRCHTFFIGQGCDAVWWGCTELAFLSPDWCPLPHCMTPMDAMVSAVMERWSVVSLPAAPVSDTITQPY